MARTCGQEGHQEGGVGSEHCLAASEPATSKPCTTVQTEQTLISRARPRRRGCRRGPGCEKGPRVAGTSGECRALYSSAGSSLAETRRSDSEAHAFQPGSTSTSYVTPCSVGCTFCVFFCLRCARCALTAARGRKKHQKACHAK